MGLSLRRWRPRHLLVAWSLYWIVLILVGLGSVLAAIWRVTRDPDAHGTISAAMTNGVVQLSVTDPGGTIVERSISLLSMALWVAGPPLLLWLAWLATRPRAAESRVASSSAP